MWRSRGRTTIHKLRREVSGETNLSWELDLSLLAFRARREHILVVLAAWCVLSGYSSLEIKGFSSHHITALVPIGCAFCFTLNSNHAPQHHLVSCWDKFHSVPCSPLPFLTCLRVQGVFIPTFQHWCPHPNSPCPMLASFLNHSA